MRKLVYIALGFGGGCLLGAYVLSPEHLWIGGIIALLLAIPVAAVSSESRTAFAVTLFLLGCGAGLMRFGLFHAVFLEAPADMDGKLLPVSIRVNDYSRETEYGRSVDGTLSLEGRSYRVRAYLDPGRELSPGTSLSGDFLLRFTPADGEEEGTYHPGRGIFLLAYQRGSVTETEGPAGWRDSPAVFRRKILDSLEASFPEDTVPFVKALLLGDTSELDYETDTAMQLSGIRHVAAVSGLHISILFALINTLTLRKRFLTALLGYPALLLFAALAGFSPSVIRACMMSGLMLLATLAEKEYDPVTALGFAAITMLAWNPMVITSVGFQLSAASVAGIYLFSLGIRAWMLEGLTQEWRTPVGSFFANWLSASVSTSLSAMVLTTPLCAGYFGMVSLIGMVTNLLTLWVISTVFYGAMGVCLLFWLWPGTANILAWVIAWPVRYVLMMSKVLADFPLAAVYTASPYVVLWLVFAYVLLLIFRCSEQKRVLVPGCCAVISLCAALALSWAEPLVGDARFTMLDVGQGQCLLFQCKGRSYLIDCGGDEDAEAANLAAQTLLSQGIAKLDGLFLTHLDRDHAGGAGYLLSRVDTELLVLPDEYSELTHQTYAEVVYASQDLILDCGDCKIFVFAANFEGNSNEKSLCLLLDTEKCDILITGDRNAQGERYLLREDRVGDVDILVAGHHGSKNSTSEALLSAVKPEIVCISVGKDNSYGHPAAELLQRLQEFGCTVYRTDKHGTITLRR